MAVRDKGAMGEKACAWVRGLPRVILYGEPSASGLRISEIAGYLQELLPGLSVQIRPSLVAWYLESQSIPRREALLSELARRFAELKIRNPMVREQDFPVLPGEVAYEQRRLFSSAPPFGLVYRGEGVMGVLEELLPRPERNLSHLHIVFTKQLLGTWGEGRYHLRAAVLGFPSLLSTTGLVEAPAKPREFYLLKERYAALGMSDAVVELEEELGDRILRHGDARLTEVMKGYVMQALFYHATGDPFCDEGSCRLYNAHWQEELLNAQLGGAPQFCSRHQNALKRMNEGRIA